MIRYISLAVLVLAIVVVCMWQQSPTNNPKVLTKEEILARENIGVKWHDSLFKHLPTGIDTSIVVVDSKGNPLHFRQYVKLVFNHEAIIFRDKVVWRLHRLTQESQDSLKKDDYAVSGWERWDAWRKPDTIINWKEKLKNIAYTLNQADYIVVAKSLRKMLVYRKGKQVFKFDIDLGYSPVGNKIKDGDGKTPEGTYHLDQKHVREDKFYKSFLISYPNAADKALAKERSVKAGFSILIHGTTAAKVNATDWTAGCIALQNKDIDSLFNRVASGTIIEIRK